MNYDHPRYEGEERRKVSSHDISDLYELLSDVKTKIEVHIATEQETTQALKELVIIWKGSKIIIPFLAACAIGAWSLIEWAKDHLK